MCAITEPCHDRSCCGKCFDKELCEYTIICRIEHQEGLKRKEMGNLNTEKKVKDVTVPSLLQKLRKVLFL